MTREDALDLLQKNAKVEWEKYKESLSKLSLPELIDISGEIAIRYEIFDTFNHWEYIYDINGAVGYLSTKKNPINTVYQYYLDDKDGPNLRTLYEGILCRLNDKFNEDDYDDQVSLTGGFEDE